MPAAALYLIRHAESAWNASGRWQGHADPPLSSRGRDQARRLAGDMESVALDRVVSSDLARAVATAEAIALPRGLDVERDPALRELDVGRWAGLTREQIEAQDPKVLAAFEREEPSTRPGDGETRLELRARARRVVAELVAHSDAERIAVVAHLGVIRAVLSGVEFENAEWRRVEPEALTAPR